LKSHVSSCYNTSHRFYVHLVSKSSLDLENERLA
jgi:hypothetical protein